METLGVWAKIFSLFLLEFLITYGEEHYDRSQVRVWSQEPGRLSPHPGSLACKLFI